jgi:hypothetical protein
MRYLPNMCCLPVRSRTVCVPINVHKCAGVVHQDLVLSSGTWNRTQWYLDLMVDLMVGLIKKINEYIIQSYYHHQIHHIFQIGRILAYSYFPVIFINLL